MKLFPNLLSGVTQALISVFKNNYQADKVLDYLFKDNPKWGSRDRAFIAESVYNIVRNWRKLWAISNMEIELTHNQLLKLFAVYWVLKGENLPPWDEFKQIDFDTINERVNKTFSREVEYSIHHEFDTIAYEELGAKWEEELNAMNQLAKVVLRVNTIKTTKQELAKVLSNDNFDTEVLPEAPNALVLTERKNIFAQPTFKAGYFEIQDAGSQLIAPFLEIEEGMRVIDACAGAGGKALHLATLMNNKGRVIAMDVEAKKLEELKRRSRRNGISIIETRIIDSSKAIKRLHDTADRLLLDVPCSGSGVLKRNPDAKLRIDKRFIDSVINTQQDILQRYTKMLKVGGKLVYATCSLLPSENRKQIDKFISNNPNYIVEAEQMIYPSEFGFDGFYMARLLKR